MSIERGVPDHGPRFDGGSPPDPYADIAIPRASLPWRVRARRRRVRRPLLPVWLWWYLLLVAAYLGWVLR